MRKKHTQEGEISEHCYVNHTEGCPCARCRHIDGKNWYAPSSPYQMGLDELLRKRPGDIRSCISATTMEDTFWDEEYYE